MEVRIIMDKDGDQLELRLNEQAWTGIRITPELAEVIIDTLQQYLVENEKG